MKLWALEQDFQVCTTNNSNTYNLNIAMPTMKFSHGIATMNGPSWVVPRLDGGHIEFVNANISVLY